MGQVLRITYNNSDYHFQILNHTPVSKETGEIQILLDGVTQTLVCRDRKWVAKTEHGPETGLTEAIGKAIALRYRI